MEFQTNDIVYSLSCEGVNWETLRDRLIEDQFHNGRTVSQYQRSFENSRVVVFAWHGDQLVGKARALSDGVCNAYVVDVWTYTPYRRKGVASEMMGRLLDQLTGQHVYLFSDDAIPFYEGLGFEGQGVGLGLVKGEWLQNSSRS